MYFSALFLYRSVTASDIAEPPLYEETLVLIEADSMAEARRQAESMAQAPPQVYQNVRGETVTVTCERLVDVYAIAAERLEHGAELYSRHFTNYDAYRQFDPLVTTPKKEEP